MIFQLGSRYLNLPLCQLKLVKGFFKVEIEDIGEALKLFELLIIGGLGTVELQLVYTKTKNRKNKSGRWNGIIVIPKSVILI